MITPWPNPRALLDAAVAFSLHIGRHRRRASEPERKYHSRIMKFRHLLSAGLAAILLSSSSKTLDAQTPDGRTPDAKTLDASFQKAIESDLLHTRAFLRTLRALDSGDATKARKIAVIPVLMDLDFAQYYFTQGLAPPTPEQTQQWTEVASQTLDYMLKHRDEWDSQRVDVQGGMRGLRYFLTKPEVVHRLDELSGPLVENKKKAWEMNPALFTDGSMIAAGILFALAPFDKKRVRAGWAKLAFGIIATISTAVGVVRLAWNLDCFQLGPDAFVRVNDYVCIASGVVIGTVIALALSRQFTGAKRDV